MVTRSYLSTTTLNRNGLNALRKRQRLAECIQEYTVCKEHHLITRDIYRLKVMARKKPFYENGEQKKLGGAILI